MTALLAATAIVALGSFFVMWLISLVARDASIVDPFWGISFVLVAWVAWIVGESPGSRQLLTALLVTAWGLRLSLFLASRNLGRGEDYRYQAMRRRWGRKFPLISLGTVFVLQAALMWVVSMPVQVTMLDRGAPGALSYLGIGLWTFGMIFEAGGDWQLARFRRDPANAGRVMDRGLWRYTRHPNYFGDFCVWWGLFLIALGDVSMAWTIVGPVLMTLLLLRISGVALLESTISKRRPDYAAYARRTAAFFPRRPRPEGG